MTDWQSIVSTPVIMWPSLMVLHCTLHSVCPSLVLVSVSIQCTKCHMTSSVFPPSMESRLFQLRKLYHLYILNAVRCPYVRSSVTSGVASSVANDVIMRIASLVAGCKRRRRERRKWCHNENDVTVITAGLWRYGDWRHVATDCNALI